MATLSMLYSVLTATLYGVAVVLISLVRWIARVVARLAEFAVVSGPTLTGISRPPKGRRHW